LQLYPDEEVPVQIQAVLDALEKAKTAAKAGEFKETVKEEPMEGPVVDADFFTKPEPPENGKLETGKANFEELQQAIENAGENVVALAEKQTGVRRDTPSDTEAVTLTKRIGTLLDMQENQGIQF
jgi:hypothetical protein